RWSSVTPTMSRTDLPPQPRPGRRWGSAAARLLPDQGPVRRLAVLTLTSTTGNGVFFTLAALYYTRILGFSVVSVGIGLSVAGVIQGAGRATARAYLRAVSNLGMTFGALIAAIALHVDTRAVYVAVMYVDAATYVICGAIALGLPRVTPERDDQAGGMFAAAR